MHNVFYNTQHENNTENNNLFAVCSAASNSKLCFLGSGDKAPYHGEMVGMVDLDWGLMGGMRNGAGKRSGQLKKKG